MSQSVAIVILNYNGEKYLQKFLPSVVRYSKGHRIIVADNCSTDKSIVFLNRNYPEVEILQLPDNFGFAGGYDRALKQISATYYVLLNSDVEVSEGWLTPMKELLDRNPRIAACQPKIRAYHQPGYFEYAGASGGFVDILGFPFCRGRVLDTLEEDKGQYNSAIPVFWATGACMMIRSSVYHGMGGFDHRFFAHMEEIDLCWRMHLASYQIFACPASTVYHVGGGTLPKHNPHKTFLNFRNGLWMLYKNSSTRDLYWKIPARLVLDWAGSLFFITKGQYKDAKAVLRAHKSFIKSIPEFSKDRKRLKEVKVKDAPLYRLLIVWEYFIKGKKSFAELVHGKKKPFMENNFSKI